MQYFKDRAEDIPGLIRAAWVFKGTDLNGEPISMLYMADGSDEVTVDVTKGIEGENVRMTPRMQSYLTGMTDIGNFLKHRKTVDEDGVTVDDLEQAAILFAFPKVAKSADAMKVLKTHLDGLQMHKVLPTLEFKLNGAGAAKAAEPAPAPRAEKPVEKPVQAAAPAKAEPVKLDAAMAAKPADNTAAKPDEIKPAEIKQADAAKPENGADVAAAAVADKAISRRERRGIFGKDPN